MLRQLKREHDGVRVPRIVFTKGGGPWLEQIAAIGADVVGLDWTVNLGAARAARRRPVALQGNLDPAVLFARPEQIARRSRGARSTASAPPRRDARGHVFNLGHGISQHTPPDSVARWSRRSMRISRPSKGGRECARGVAERR